MGNTDSTSGVTPLFYGKELKWKSGAVSSSIPYNDSFPETYEQLKLSSSAKSFIFQHIHSDDLVNSLLSNEVDEGAVLEGISSYLNSKPEEVETLVKDLKNLENSAAAGISVRQLLFQCSHSF
jgi:hypothetical protein